MPESGFWTERQVSVRSSWPAIWQTSGSKADVYHAMASYYQENFFWKHDSLLLWKRAGAEILNPKNEQCNTLWSACMALDLWKQKHCAFYLKGWGTQIHSLQLGQNCFSVHAQWPRRLVRLSMHFFHQNVCHFYTWTEVSSQFLLEKEHQHADVFWDHWQWERIICQDIEWSESSSLVPLKMQLHKFRLRQNRRELQVHCIKLSIGHFHWQNVKTCNVKCTQDVKSDRLVP